MAGTQYLLYSETSFSTGEVKKLRRQSVSSHEDHVANANALSILMASVPSC